MIRKANLEKAMSQPAPDTTRFKPFHEPIYATLLRTGSIAIIIALVVTRLRLGHMPASPTQWYACLSLIILFAFPSFGGHWIEIIYLNKLRPKLSERSNAFLILTRLATWFLGGLILLPTGVITYSMLTTNQFPRPHALLRTVLFAGPLMIAIELTVHTLLLLTRRPSFWNLQG